MLNKEICQKCYENNGINWDGQIRLSTAEIRWTNQRKILCPFPFAEGKTKFRIFDSPLMMEEADIENIPDYCPYQLEHLVDAVKK